MDRAKKHPSISIADQGILLKLLSRHAAAFLRRFIGSAVVAACLAISVRQTLADYEVPDPSYDPPASYYNSATGTGTTLKGHLNSIITSGFTGETYGEARSILPILWEDPNDSARMILIYNNQSLLKPTGGSIPGWDGGTSWNREHMWPQSKLGATASNGVANIASDLFELAPCLPSINGSRSNDAYATYTSTGTYQNLSAGFYPGDAHKGDVARSIFYMATRYSQLSVINGTSISTFQMGDLASLLRWNYTDGVDNFERRKNDLIYDDYQHNRNPYIDHPEYVWAVFGGSNNSSQISVASPASDGSSSTTVNLNDIIVGGSFGTSNVTISKSGTTPTTYDISASGSAITTGSGQLVGTGHPFDYNSQSKSMTVSLNASANATPGAKTGTITIDNTDLTTAGTGQGSADGNDIVTVNANVLNHANASFAASNTDSQTIDIGIYSTGSGTQQSGFNIYNLTTTAGFTAPLVYVSSPGTGNTSQLTTNIAAAFTSPVTEGNNVALLASLSTASAGTFSATYTMNLSDDTSLSGATGQSLSLTLQGKARGASTIYWNAAADSAWDLSHTKKNWTDLSSNEVFLQGDTVVFDDGHNPSGSRSVTLNTSVTPASVTVEHSSGADYTISGSGAIGGSGGLTKNGSGKLTLSTNNTYTGGTTVNAGTLVVGHYHGLGNSNLTINGTATTQLAAGITSTNAAGSGAVQLDLLSIAGGATPTAFFDITDNNLIVHNGDYNTLNAQVTNSLYSGFWAGEGIGSSTANTDGNGDKAIGIVNNDDGGGGAFFSSWPSGADSGGAVSTTNTDVLIRYTYFGDANLDGITDADEDFSLWLTGSTSEGALGGWLFGDFNYDGQVDNSDDYALWLTGATSGGSPLGGGVQPVPEPSTLLLAALGLAGVAAFARRRRAETAPI